MNNSWKRRVELFKKKLTNDNNRTKMQFFFVYIIFAVVSFIMTVVNFLTGFTELGYCTLVFGVLNVVNVFCSGKGFVWEKISHILFAVEIVALFSVLLITGSPEGFSAIWIALLPAAGMLLYRMKYGTALSLGMFAILVFFCWIPFGRSLLMFDYTDSFLLRFPILYLVFYAVGLFFEVIRSLTQKELNQSKERYRRLSYTDQLTGLGNESLYLSRIDEIVKTIDAGKARFAVVFMDVNGVKATNDQFGHRFGCHLIVSTGKMLPTIFRTSYLFHLGGDEFVAIVTGDDYDHLNDRIRQFDAFLEYRIIKYEKTDLVLSVARGYSVYQSGDKYNSVVQRADSDMYRNKRAIKQKYGLPDR